jgi:hypothetical protein
MNKFLIIILVMMITGVALSNEQVSRADKTFNELRADNLGILDSFYSKDVSFLDPIGKHKGLDAVKAYYKNIYKNVKSIRFDFKETISEGNKHVLIWDMHLVAEGLNGGKETITHGNSVIKFNEENLVSYHRDYFDMGEFIYQHIPIISFLIKKINNRLKE